MSPQVRPEASYASIRLTKRNCTRNSHLLSTFNKGDNDDAEPPPKLEKRHEPRIDEAPIGSSEDEEEQEQERDSDLSDIEGGGKGVNDQQKRKLDDKIADNDMPAPRRSARGLPLSSQQSGDAGSELASSQEKHLARSSDAMDGADEQSELFDIWGSSQQSKKRKTAHGFGSRRRSSNKAPFSSAPSSSAPSEPPSSAPGKKGAKKATGKTPKEKKSCFQMPREIDISSPPPKARTNGNPAKSVFKTPPNDITSVNLEEALEMLSQNDDMSSLSSLVDTPSSPSSAFNFELSQADNSLTAKEDEQETWQPKPAVCPMCKEEVDPEALARFEVQSKQRFREQVGFCDSHQTSKAEKEWKNKGYPIIDWDTFDERIRSHFNDLEKFLVPGNSSHYRNLLDGDLKAGKAKNFRLTLSGGGLENISCGYYGTRGSGKMYSILRFFSSTSPRRAWLIVNWVKVTSYYHAFCTETTPSGSRRPHRQNGRCCWLRTSCPCPRTSSSTRQGRHERQRRIRSAYLTRQYCDW